LHSRNQHATTLSVGDTLELVAEKGVYRGLGLFRAGGQVIFAPDVFAGERARLRIESIERGYARAKVEAVLEPSAARRASPCRYVPQCGGCSYQELQYAAQLELKARILRESLERAGVRFEGDVALRPSPEDGWRTRAGLHLARRGEEWLLGLREEGSHRVVDIQTCLQLSEGLNRAARGLLEALKGDPALLARLRGIELAESLDGSERVACLDTTLPVKEAARYGSATAELPWLTGLGVLSQAESRSGRFVQLRGEPYVYASVAGLRLRSHVRSFFQANRYLLADLVSAVLARVPEGGSALDLFAGVGLFALPLSAGGRAVCAAEINPFAIDDAIANAAAAGLDLRLERADVREALQRWPPARDERVVLDPPRTGAGREVVAALVARKPAAVVYVSCDPPTLGRDLRMFADSGYRLESLEAFDMFPDTFHLESLALLRPA
jgi:23S rRNA (uracil1939-C5)-methyltransferase